MLIGVPKEQKTHEYRVGATPSMVDVLVKNGHKVLIQSNAGLKSGFNDESFTRVGATIVQTPQEVYLADMIIKVKEPQPSEYPLLQEGQILFCYLHLAPDPQQTEQLVKSKVVAIAYETVTDGKGNLPLLVPMSEIAGRLSIQVGANALQMNNGGKGLVLGGVPGVTPARVIIIGGGVVGTEAARMALGLGADVIVIDKNLNRLRQLDQLYGPRLKTLFSSSLAIEKATKNADLVIGAVLIPGKTAPTLINKKLVNEMEPGTVFVDVAIDQGGCSETSKPTTHENPTYLVDGVIHYCVTNMPGACSRTSTLALTNATLEYVLKLANKGYRLALNEDPHLRHGLNVYRGHITNEHVAHDLNYEYTPAEHLL
jgi:alanine dehydrogenase